MKLITQKGEEYFEKTDIKLQDGQRSGFCKNLYKTLNDGRLWTLKDTKILKEYLGFTLFKSLGISVAQFGVGYTDPEERDNGGSPVFICEYIDNTNDYKIVSSNNKIDLGSLPVTKLIPLMLASIIIGDSDATGKNNDNFLLKKSKTNGNILDLYKIDCGRAFENLHLSIEDCLSGDNHFFGKFDNFIKGKKDQPGFIEEAKNFLETIDEEKIIDELKNSFMKFDSFVAGQKHMQDLLDKYKIKPKSTSLAFLYSISERNKPPFDLIEELQDTIKGRIVALKDTFFNKNTQTDKKTNSSSSLLFKSVSEGDKVVQHQPDKQPDETQNPNSKNIFSNPFQ